MCFTDQHPYWGSQKSDPRGNMIFNEYCKSTFILLNYWSPISVPTTDQPTSTIDLMLSNAYLHPLVQEWKIGQDPIGSDHHPIFITINKENANSTFSKWQ